MHPSQLSISEFTYELPDERIARNPLPERDASKLLLYRNGKIEEDIYRNLADYLPEKSLLVFNQTKVIHARLMFQKPTGGRIEVFCLEPDSRYADVQTAMLQKGGVYWRCMVGGAAKWKEGQQLSLVHDLGHFEMAASICSKEQGYFVLHLTWAGDVSFAEALQVAGSVPLPPYLDREATAEDEQRYQTIFAHEEGSVAAPTAALHFTPQLMGRIHRKGVNSGLVTLHVGAGTFKPVKAATMQGHDMHAEWIEVTLGFLEELLRHLTQKLPVVAVGTTSARTLESLYWIGFQVLLNGALPTSEIAVPQWLPYEHTAKELPENIIVLSALIGILKSNGIHRLVGKTQIIVAPGYRFKIMDALITNFHQPQSTLLLLVSALIGEDWRKVYQYALTRDFRFLSYGDGCLLWPNHR
ncbi:MAG: S-adenosylmethionine:tRNA ribosyltransferase-isomerase [Edaphocola sp.]